MCNQSIAIYIVLNNIYNTIHTHNIVKCRLKIVFHLGKKTDSALVPHQHNTASVSVEILDSHIILNYI